MFLGSIETPYWWLTWRTWAPLWVKIFFWLALRDRCWKVERLARHGLPHGSVCLLCDQATETMAHLLSGCPFSRQVWYDSLAWCRLPASTPTADTPFIDWLAASAATIPACLRRGFTTLALLIAWEIWKQRNACIFNAAQPSISKTVVTIREEARGWAHAGARGLGLILPDE